MFNNVTARYRDNRSYEKDKKFIYDSIMEAANGEEEVLDSMSEEGDIDVDSVPDTVVNKLDKMLDKIVDSPNYDDTELDELVDDEDDDDPDDSIEVGELGQVLGECCTMWENIENGAMA